MLIITQRLAVTIQKINEKVYIKLCLLAGMEVIIYTIPTCPWSAKAKTWIKKKKLSFEERNVAESQNGGFRDEMLNKTSQLKTPVIEINGQVVVGFDEEKLNEIISSA